MIFFAHTSNSIIVSATSSVLRYSLEHPQSGNDYSMRQAIALLLVVWVWNFHLLHYYCCQGFTIRTMRLTLSFSRHSHSQHQPICRVLLYQSSPEAVNILENNDDSSARTQFGTRVYWDELYQGRGDFPADEYQWYYGFEEYGKFVTEHVSRTASVLLPGIGNDPIILDLLQKGYQNLTGTDYSEHAIERQQDLLSYEYGGNVETVTLQQMDARAMPAHWSNNFDAILEKGALDAIYLSGDGNLEKTAQELERVLKPGGILISVSGVVPAELRNAIFDDEGWQWMRDGGDDLKAGIFVLKLISES